LVALLAVAVSFATAVVLAKIGRAPLRSAAESAVGYIVWYGFPATAALITLTVFRRHQLGFRIVWALIAGTVGIALAEAAALAAVCAVIGECL
jgi:hypothetical protein